MTALAGDCQRRWVRARASRPSDRQESAIDIRRAVLLAAGRGTRVGALTAETPKCLLPINGRAMLDRQLEALVLAGVEEVMVVAGFMADAVIRHVAGLSSTSSSRRPTASPRWPWLPHTCEATRSCCKMGTRCTHRI